MAEELTQAEIDQILNQLKTESKRYVAYDPDTGNLLFTAQEQPSVPHIKVEFNEIATILSGKERMEDYKVVFDLKTKEFILQAYYDTEPQYISWNDAVWKIPNGSVPDPDVKVLQDSSGKWVLKFSTQVHKILLNRKSEPNQTLDFYVTKSGDANILLETIKVKIDGIDRNGTFEVISDVAKHPASIYCRRIFDSYTHEVL